MKIEAKNHSRKEAKNHSRKEAKNNSIKGAKFYFRFWYFTNDSDVWIIHSVA